MKGSKFTTDRNSGYRVRVAHWTLSGALLLGLSSLGGFTAAQAQATAGRVFGYGPSGQTVTVRGTTGARHAKINAKGRYIIGSLPTGQYTVTLEKEGKAIDTRSKISVMAGGGSEIDFACANDQCAESAGG